MSVRPEQIGDATLYLGDCLEILPTLGKVDAVVTDPPYGVGQKYEDSYKDTQTPTEWFELIGDVQLAFTLPQTKFDQYPKPDWLVVWHKPLTLGYWSTPFIPKWEGILTWRIQAKVPDLVSYNPQRAKDIGHPTPKPVDLMRAIVRWTNGVVLDPFMGSGTTGVACAKMGRKFIGIEIEPKYFDIACKRIEETYRQPDMFIKRPKPAEQIDMLKEAVE